MTRSKTPRAVIVTRKTDYELLIERHGTHAGARFFLAMREQDIEKTLARHHSFGDELARVLSAIPRSWRRASVRRSDLHRFLFEPNDIVIAVGQDGLVANLAKYLSGQRVVGINTDRTRNVGILVPCLSADTLSLLEATASGHAHVEERTMVQAKLDDGQTLLALNELFVGHASHQSARYKICRGNSEELQSSSGIVITTGTGATGWASSIHRNRVTEVSLPMPTERRLSFFVREAWQSAATSVSLTDGAIADDDELVVTSRMNDGGVVFGDGIEADRIAFHWGSRLTLRVAPERLCLVKPVPARRQWLKTSA